MRRLRIHPAQVLLSALGKTAFSSQTFADIDGAPRKPTIRHGPWAVQRLQLEDDNRHGMGVLFCVNTTDLRGRRATNITGIAAYFIDLDGPPLPSSWPLPPTAVVESSPGRYHVYWRVMRAPMDLFTHVQKHLVVLFGSDPKVHDLPRGMRLPGLVHAKREPFVSRLVLVEPANAYEHDAFIAAFAVPPLKAPLRQAVRQMPRRGEMKYYVWAAVKGEYWRVASASEGTRNTTLFAAAVSLGTLVGAGFLAEADARDALLAGVSASPTPLPAWEAERTIASGLAFGRRHPRQLDAGDG